MKTAGKKVIFIIVGAVLLLLVIVYAWIMHKSKANQIYALGVQAYQEGDMQTAKDYLLQVPKRDGAQTLLKDISYNEAIDLFEAEDYDGAKAIFSTMSEYQESQKYLYEIQYLQVKALMEEGKYEEANTLAQEILGYSDMAEVMQEITFHRVLALIDQADIDGAKEMIAGMSDTSKAKYLYDVIAYTQDAVTCVKDLVSRYGSSGTTVDTVVDARFNTYTYSNGTYVPLFMIQAKVHNADGEDEIYGIYYGDTYYASCHSLVLDENNLKDNQEMGAYLKLQPNWDAETTVKLSAPWLNQLSGLEK